MAPSSFDPDRRRGDPRLASEWDEEGAVSAAYATFARGMSAFSAHLTTWRISASENGLLTTS